MKFVAVFLLGFLATVSCQNHVTSRIVGGREANEDEFPYVISISWRWNGETISSHGCGGTLIKNDWVLTAAHCLDWEGGEYIIRAGALHLDRTMDGEQTSLVRNIFIHPGYNPEAVASDNDIGLMQLETPFEITRSVRTLALPFPNQMPSLVDARISGWGSISNNETVIMPNTLKTILLPVLSNEECQSIIDWSGAVVHDHELCTGNGSGGKGTCGGDSGSGLMQGNTVIGVVQWGFTPCSFSPSVYARVSFYRSWIDSIIETAEA